MRASPDNRAASEIVLNARSATGRAIGDDDEAATPASRRGRVRLTGGQGRSMVSVFGEISVIPTLWICVSVCIEDRPISESVHKRVTDLRSSCHE